MPELALPARHTDASARAGQPARARRGGPQPAPELALLLSGTAAARAAHGERIRELAAGADFAALEDHLRAQGMLALLGRRLHDTAGVEPPSDFGEHVHAYALAAERHSLYQQMLTIRLIAALQDDGIRALPLKGPLLGERLYGNIATRVSADIDLLVGEPDLARAVALIAGFGYERHRRVSRRAAPPPLHVRLLHPDGLPKVELHWRVHWYETRFSADLLARSVPGRDGCLQPQPADELAELLLLYARDGFAGLRLAADLATWWDRYAAVLAPRALAETMLRYPPVAPALATAALLGERLVGLPAHELAPAGALARASRPAMRLANWPLRGKRGQISANVSLIDWALAPTGQWRALARRHLLLSRDDLLADWPDAGSSALRGLWLRAVHPVRVLARYAIAAWTVIRRGAWAPLSPPVGRSDAG